jgi:hypothetical protein
MQLHRRPNTSQWLIVVFNPSHYIAELFLPLYLNRDIGESIIRTWYPNSLTSIWLPSSMSLVMLALHQKVIGCHFSHQFILGAVGSLALSSSSHSLQSKFASKMDANDYFIAVVINAYLTITLHELNARKAARLKRKTRQAKLQWIRKRDIRRHNELYLGVQPFPYELRRCCEEFYKQLKKAWGFTPEKRFLMK